MPECNLLLYLDAGCYLNAGGKRRFGEYLDMMDATDILAFQSRSFKGTTEPDPRHHLNLERERTKGDCLDHYGVRNNPHVAETGQMVGGVVLMRNTERVRDFARRFREVFFEHFELVDDSPSRSPNEKGFIKHRHDQSIFSIMCKLEGYDRFALSSGEMFPKLRKRTPEEVAALGGRENWRYASFEEMSECPIQTRREKRLNPLARLLKNVRGAFGIDTQWQDWVMDEVQSFGNGELKADLERSLGFALAELTVAENTREQLSSGLSWSFPFFDC